MKPNAGVPIQALPSLNVVRVLDDWLDTVDVDSVRWTKRQHPDYQVSFTQQVRGQPLDIFIDYSAKTDFLGLYAYMRAFDSRGHSDPYALLNEVNLAVPYARWPFSTVWT